VPPPVAQAVESPGSSLVNTICGNKSDGDVAALRRVWGYQQGVYSPLSEYGLGHAGSSKLERFVCRWSSVTFSPVGRIDRVVFGAPW